MINFVATSMSYLVLPVLHSHTAHQLPLSPSKDITSRLHDGFHLTLLHVTSVACTQADLIFSLGRPNPNLQSSRLAVTFFHQGAALCHQPSPNLQLLFITSSQLIQGYFGQPTFCPPLDQWHPTLHCRICSYEGSRSPNQAFNLAPTGYNRNRSKIDPNRIQHLQKCTEIHTLSSLFQDPFLCSNLSLIRETSQSLSNP